MVLSRVADSSVVVVPATRLAFGMSPCALASLLRRDGRFLRNEGKLNVQR